MRVLFYGRLAEALGRELEVRADPGWSVKQVRDLLAADYPAIEDVLRGKHVRNFVGDRMVLDDYRLNHGDTLEFLPPVSGG